MSFDITTFKIACNIKPVFTVTAGSDYAQVERRSVTFLHQTMSRGEAFGLQKYIEIIHLKPLAGHSVKSQRTSPKAKPHTICKNLKSEI